MIRERSCVPRYSTRCGIVTTTLRRAILPLNYVITMNYHKSALAKTRLTQCPRIVRVICPRSPRQSPWIDRNYRRDECAAEAKERARDLTQRRPRDFSGATCVRDARSSGLSNVVGRSAFEVKLVGFVTARRMVVVGKPVFLSLFMVALAYASLFLPPSLLPRPPSAFTRLECVGVSAR